eukprot:657129-Pleurochrysis_carterae.AAC.1
MKEGDTYFGGSSVACARNREDERQVPTARPADLGTTAASQRREKKTECRMKAECGDESGCKVVEVLSRRRSGLSLPKKYSIRQDAREGRPRFDLPPPLLHFLYKPVFILLGVATALGLEEAFVYITIRALT